jgi:hypothetical protein
MAQSAIDKIPPGLKLDALTAEKVFVWQKVHMHQGSLVGRKQDKAGHWRRATVPNYSTNPLHSYSVENRMKELGRIDRYEKELPKLTRSENIPSDWATQSNAVGLRLKRWDYTARSSVESWSQTNSKMKLHHNVPRLIWMVFADPTVIAWTNRFNHSLVVVP